MTSKSSSKSVRQIAFNGLLFAMALVLSFLESMLPVFPMLPPGVKLGLSNIVTMYALFTLGVPSGITIATLKACFVFLMRGLVGGALSFAGGMTSVFCMVIISLLPGVKQNYLLLSIFGAVGHNMGQLVLAAFILQTPGIFYTLPILLIAGVCMGIVTGIVLKSVMPYINKLNLTR
ncbi:MAG: Gx transporter family protein [Angelakisella sp.]